MPRPSPLPGQLKTKDAGTLMDDLNILQTKDSKTLMKDSTRHYEQGTADAISYRSRLPRQSPSFRSPKCELSWTSGYLIEDFAVVGARTEARRRSLLTARHIHHGHQTLSPTFGRPLPIAGLVSLSARDPDRFTSWLVN